jgi:hypothetical protein
VAQSHTPRNRCVRFVFGVAAASRNTRFQAARYSLTWAGLAPADRASFTWRLPSFDHLVGAGNERRRLDEFTHECLAIRVARKLKAIDVIDVLSDLFILRGIPAHIRSDNGPEFVKAVRASTPAFAMSCSTARFSTLCARPKSSICSEDRLCFGPAAVLYFHQARHPDGRPSLKSHAMDDQPLSRRHPKLDCHEGRAREDALRGILEPSGERAMEDGLSEVQRLIDPEARQWRLLFIPADV